MSTYVVGDIQGCLKPLQCLLSEVAFDPVHDTLWSVGDAVNRGPKSLKTLRFLYNMRDSLVMVLGNHDLHLLAVAAGAREASQSDTFDKILAASDRDALLKWLIQRPIIHHQYGHTMVHAGIPPQWTVQQALAYGNEVQQVLRSTDCVEFFSQMYGNEPAIWSENLKGMERLRVITNYLTRMRYCDKNGRLDLASKGATPNADLPQKGPKRVSAWFSHKNRKTAQDPIIFGHWASLEGQTDNDKAIALDTGCVWGRYMSLYELETGHWTRCACS